MKNTFILHLSMREPEEIIHYNETVINKVDQKIIFPFVDDSTKELIQNDFEDSSVIVWRLSNNAVNRSKFDKLTPGDEILVVEDDVIKFLGKISTKIVSEDLARKLWISFSSGKMEKLSLIFFILDSSPMNLPFSELAKLLGYGEGWIPDGLTLIDLDKLCSLNLENEGLCRVLKGIEL